MTTVAAATVNVRRAPTPLVIRGTLLRSVLLLELDRRSGRAVRIAELCAALDGAGFAVAGRVSKVVSDALRCEVLRGRVVHTARGVYRIGRLPGTTRWRCRRRVAAARAGAAPPSHLGGPRPRRTSSIPSHRLILGDSLRSVAGRWNEQGGAALGGRASGGRSDGMRSLGRRLAGASAVHTSRAWRPGAGLSRDSGSVSGPGPPWSVDWTG